MLLVFQVWERNGIYMENANGYMSEITKIVWDKLSVKSLDEMPQKFAVQVNLTGKCPGVFYIEILNGVLSVEPYEYIDKDGEIDITKTNLLKLTSGKMKLNDSKITIKGNIEKVMMLESLFA